MINNYNVIEMIKRDPEPYENELPKWGKPILEFVGKHYFLEADQIIQNLFGSGNRNARKKLFELSQKDYLVRYELFCEDKETPILGYALSEKGAKITRYIPPRLSINRAQEYIIANEFYFMRGHLLDGWKLLSGSQLIIAELLIEGQKFGLWPPREEDTRIKSLLTESMGLQGLIVIAPSELILTIISTRLEALNLNKPIYYTIDSELEILRYMDEGNLKVLTDVE